MFSFIQFITLTKFAKNALKTAYIPKVQMELGLHNISDERTKKKSTHKQQQKNYHNLQFQ